MAYMKDAAGQRLDSYEVQGNKPSNIATRIFGGRMGTFNNTTSNTFQITTELAQHFDAVRVIFANSDTGFSHSMRQVAVSVIPDKTDLNNSAGTWTLASRSGMGRVYAEIAPGAGRIAYTMTDWINVSSIPRTDGGTHPLLVVRAFMQATAALPVYGDGIDDFTNWATRTDGRIWVARNQTGLHTSTTTGFTSTTNANQSPIVGIQYLSRGKVITVCGVGDSITDGRGGYFNEGFIMPATEALSDPAGTAYEYMNCGWSGQAMVTFAERAIDILQSEVRPDILVLPAASPNDAVSTITAANVAAFRGQRSRVLAEARRLGVPVVTWTWLPVNTATRPWGATDALRTAYNAEVLAQAGRGIFVADTAPAVSGVTTGSQVQMLGSATTDGIHPNPAGNAILRDVIKLVIREAARTV